MAKSVLVDAGFLVALLSRRDTYHRWAVSQTAEFGPPWRTCESVISETFHLLGGYAVPSAGGLLRRNALIVEFDLVQNLQPVLKLLQKYEDVPMSLADACLVRMTELLTDSVVLTTDTDFHIYRRNGRQTVPSLTPH